MTETLRGISGGFFTVIEGPDGAGKTTVAHLLSKLLRENNNFSVTFTREPGATDVGRKLRAILLNNDSDVVPEAEQFLYAADRVQHLKQVVFPALADKKVVLCDRYYPSTYAYQGYGNDVSIADLQRMQRLVGTIEPDLMIVLTCPPEVGLKRNAAHKAKADEQRFELKGQSFHEKVSRGYSEIFETNARYQLFHSFLAEVTHNDIEHTVPIDICVNQSPMHDLRGSILPMMVRIDTNGCTPEVVALLCEQAILKVITIHQESNFCSFENIEPETSVFETLRSSHTWDTDTLYQVSIRLKGESYHNKFFMKPVLSFDGSLSASRSFLYSDTEMTMKVCSVLDLSLRIECYTVSKITNPLIT